MSQQWTDHGGVEGRIENPDPEEDSDLPGRSLEEDEENRADQDRPEDEILHGVAVHPIPDEEIPSTPRLLNLTENESMNATSSCPVSVSFGHAGINDNSVVLGGDQEARCCGNEAMGEGNLQYRYEEANVSTVERDIQEEDLAHYNPDQASDYDDSFEDEAAAPECENEVILDPTSESDRQPLSIDSIVFDHPSGVVQDNAIINLGDELSEPGGQMHSLSSGAFSGNVAVFDYVDDAPEAELENVQNNSISKCNRDSEQDNPVQYEYDVQSSSDHALASNSHADSENNPPGHVTNSVALSIHPDQQAPECDRGNSQHLCEVNTTVSSSFPDDSQAVRVDQSNGAAKETVDFIPSDGLEYADLGICSTLQESRLKISPSEDQQQSDSLSYLSIDASDSKRTVESGLTAHQDLVLNETDQSQQLVDSGHESEKSPDTSQPIHESNQANNNPHTLLALSQNVCSGKSTQSSANDDQDMSCEVTNIEGSDSKSLDSKILTGESKEWNHLQISLQSHDSQSNGLTVSATPEHIPTMQQKYAETTPHTVPLPKDQSRSTCATDSEIAPDCSDVDGNTVCTNDLSSSSEHTTKAHEHNKQSTTGSCAPYQDYSLQGAVSTNTSPEDHSDVSKAITNHKLITSSNSSSNSSLSSSVSQPTQRNSPAKAVASALLHVMGMDSKFTGKDLALALQSDDEDDLMSELDAELLSTNKLKKESKSQNKKAQSMKSSKPVKSDSLPAANGIPSASDVQLLQDHNRQLIEQLRIRDEEIARLSKNTQAQQSGKRSTSSHSADDLYLPQIKELERTIAQQGSEIKTLTEKLYNHDTNAKRTIQSLQNEMKTRVDQANKMYEDCRKEKDVIVVKFAEAEAKNMEAKTMTEKSEAKVREAYKERENMSQGLKAARFDRQKTIASYEAKCAEVGNLHKELEKMKEAINSAEYRIKWFQNKLKDELEAHKVTKSNVEKTNLRLKEAREETELIRKECQSIVKRYQESEEIKSNSLDKELKMKESELQTQMQERSDTQEIHQMVKQELESLKSQHKDTLQEATTLRDKVTCLEEERQQNHSMMENYQEIMQKQKSDNSELTAKLNSLANIDEDYKRAQDMIGSLDKDMCDLKITNRDLQKDMDSCRERESKMLTLQSELSRANAMLRSENTNLSNKATSLGNEVEAMRSQIERLEKDVNDLTEALEAQKTKHKESAEQLNKLVTEKTKESNDFRQKWEDEMDNTKTLKRKHANNIKDLTRQLQQAKRRLESYEGKGDGGSMGSRTNSNGSLNSVDNPQQHHQSHNHHHQQQTAPSIQEFPVITEQVEVDKNVLIERIVRLQKSHARKNEKLEFLGEHIQQLLEEIKKKTKIIQSYALREEAGALSSDDMDAHKSLLARKGGIMASVYAVHQQDGNMTLDLSLQINKKLQAVLEDTLLKNITLKENLDTLGEEIARLSQENRRLQLHLQGLEKRC